MKCLAFLLPILLLGLVSCEDVSTEPSGSGPLPVHFTLDNLPKGLNPDSLNVGMTVGDSASTLVFDWKSGSSQGSLRAKEGDSFTVHFELYACDFRIGRGESTGVFKKNQTLVLRAEWDSGAIAKARLCRMGSCVPANPDSGFNLALAGRLFEFPASCDSGATYRWFMKRGDRTVLTGEGRRNAFLIPDSLANTELAARIQVVVGGKVKEERTWIVRVISGISGDRLARVLIRNAPSTDEGTSRTLVYDDKGRVVAIHTYDSLFPTSDAKPMASDSLFYDEAGRLGRTRTSFARGSGIDSVFNYYDSGLLRSVKVTGGSSDLLDSLVYDAGKLVLSLRFVSGTLRDSVVYGHGDGIREDSVFSAGTSGRPFVRLIQNYYRSDSLIERRVWVNRNGLAPYTREFIVYNGIGKRGYRQVFSVGQALTLEESDRYAYDSQGRLASSLRRDEVRGEYLLAVEYKYAGSAVLAKTASAPRSHDEGRKPLSDLHFAYEGWELAQSAIPHP
ncbi:MAG TPA: hypothetical protein VK465_18575 [Fibrobacteria bacterium]|nr:hypothetical protein [Fibrobacteria bacterium]